MKHFIIRYRESRTRCGSSRPVATRQVCGLCGTVRIRLYGPLCPDPPLSIRDASYQPPPSRGM